MIVANGCPAFWTCLLGSLRMTPSDACSRQWIVAFHYARPGCNTCTNDWGQVIAIDGKWHAAMARSGDQGLMTLVACRWATANTYGKARSSRRKRFQWVGCGAKLLDLLDLDEAIVTLNALEHRQKEIVLSSWRKAAII